MQLKDDFEFHLYVAFQDADQSIGLQLCEGLERINERLKYNNFKLTIRLSEDIYAKKKPPRWDEKYIEAELTPHAGKLKKVELESSGDSSSEAIDKEDTANLSAEAPSPARQLARRSEAEEIFGTVSPGLQKMFEN